jgi:hypothetical protein
MNPTQRRTPDNTQHSTRDKQPCFRRNSNPQSQQASGHYVRPTELAYQRETVAVRVLVEFRREIVVVGTIVDLGAFTG